MREIRPNGDQLTWLVTWNTWGPHEQLPMVATIYSESFEHAIEQVLAMRSHHRGIKTEEGFKLEFIGVKYEQRFG